MEFTGFSPETIDFLWGIRMNNNREWFTAHKQDYLEQLYRPMVALSEAIREPFRDVPGMGCKVSRIYRDMRMHHADGPYKESLWISLRPDAFYWGEHPCLYFEIRPEGAEYGFVLWHPQTAVMQRFRKELLEAPDRFLEIAETAERETGMILEGQDYKRPKPFTDPRTERFISKKNLMCGRPVPVGPELFDPALAEQVRETLRKLLPLYAYFTTLEA